MNRKQRIATRMASTLTGKPDTLTDTFGYFSSVGRYKVRRLEREIAKQPKT